MALSHFQCNDETLIDPYFTPNEWERRSERARTILSEIRELNKTELAGDNIRKKCEELPVRCKCRVHTALKMEWVLNLMEISEPMNDSDGLELAKYLIPEILKRGGGSLPSLKVEECRQGTELKVEYILRLPGGQSVHLSGWPDFSILYKLAPTPMKRKAHRLYGVGEVQSKPATKSMEWHHGHYSLRQCLLLLLWNNPHCMEWHHGHHSLRQCLLLFHWNNPHCMEWHHGHHSLRQCLLLFHWNNPHCMEWHHGHHSLRQCLLLLLWNNPHCMEWHHGHHSLRQCLLLLLWNNPHCMEWHHGHHSLRHCLLLLQL